MEHLHGAAPARAGPGEATAGGGGGARPCARPCGDAPLYRRAAHPQHCLVRAARLRARAGRGLGRSSRGPYDEADRDVNHRRRRPMAGRLKGKVALVTAAGQGIGRAIAAAFAAEGARVIATDLDAGKLKGLRAAERRALDVRSTAAVEALAKEVGRTYGALDVLANCAGFVHHGSVIECSEADWDFSFDLNVK